MKGKYKIIVLDLDGTLTNSEKIISGPTKQALLEAAEFGIKIVLASGRPTAGINDLAQELRLDEFGGYILSYNGGNIIDCKTKKVIFKREISTSMYAEIFDMQEICMVDILTYEEDYILTNNINNKYVQKEVWINHMPIKEVKDIRNYIKSDVPKFIFPDDGDYLESIEGKVKAKLGQKMEVYRSEPFFLEILPRGVDKAKSLEKLLTILGIDVSEMIACGDGYNDLSMIKYAGLGVAMANAVLPVREAADYITASNNEDGVAQVVRQFIL